MTPPRVLIVDDEAPIVELVGGYLAASVAAVIVSVALSTRLSRPISRLAQASRRIATGRYAERVQVTSEDEIGELADSFNTLAASLETTERRRLELVGDVAHELRTPLTTLDGYLEGLEDGIIQPRDATWTLLRHETARLARLVNDLQELGRGRRGSCRSPWSRCMSPPWRRPRWSGSRPSRPNAGWRSSSRRRSLHYLPGPTESDRRRSWTTCSATRSATRPMARR